MRNRHQVQGILTLLMVGAAAEAAEMVLLPAPDSESPTRRVLVGRSEIMSNRAGADEVLLIDEVTDQGLTTAWVGSLAAIPIGGPSAEQGWLAVAHHGPCHFDDQTIKSLEVAAQLVEDQLDSDLEHSELRGLSETLLEDQDWLLQTQQQLTRANRRLSLRATTDSLTGLANRRKIQETLATTGTNAETKPSANVLEANRAVAVIDLDGFKSINDSHGHGTGDALLAAVAGRINSHIGHSDIAGRWGGDEFIVIFAGPISLADAQDRSTALGEALDGPYLVNGEYLKISASIGVALEWPGHDPVATIAAADREMYKNKRLSDS